MAIGATASPPRPIDNPSIRPLTMPRLPGMLSCPRTVNEIHEPFSFERPSKNQLAQGVARQVFHNNERPAFKLTDLVDGADVGMIEGGGRPGFTTEALESLGILGHVIGQKLEGDQTA